MHFGYYPRGVAVFSVAVKHHIYYVFGTFIIHDYGGPGVTKEQKKMFVFTELRRHVVVVVYVRGY